MSGSGAVDWKDPAVILHLRALWAAGHSTASIGRQMGCSKNAIVGKAHRLELPARPSPILPGGSGAPRLPRPPRNQKITLPPLQIVAAAMPVLTPLPTPLPTPAPLPTPVATAVPYAAPPVRPAVQPPAEPYKRVTACCWPLGEPGTREFRFCDDPGLPGKPYCQTHAALAFVRVRDRRVS